jgi:hypothetical protein
MKLTDVLKQIAPTIATLLGGPLAGLAAEAVSAAMGVPKERVEEILQKGQLSGEQIVQLRTAEQALTVKLKELDIRLEEIGVDDRKSARQREEKVGGRTTAVLAWVVVGAFVGMAFGVLFGSLKAESVLAGTVIGYLSAKAEQVLSYYFGSSRGSDDKNNLIAKLQAAVRR